MEYLYQILIRFYDCNMVVFIISLIAIAMTYVLSLAVAEEDFTSEFIRLWKKFGKTSLIVFIISFAFLLFMPTGEPLAALLGIAI